MGLYEKIEEIRRKPEHIRVRYVWAMVVVSMVFVIAIWFFSIAAGRPETPPISDEIKNSDLLDQLNQGKESIKGIKDMTENFQNLAEQQKENNLENQQ